MSRKPARTQAATHPVQLASTDPATLKEAVQEEYRTRVHLTPIPGVDIAEMKRSLDLLKYSLDYAEALVDTVRDSLLVLDKDLRVITANQSFYEKFHLSSKETEDRLIYEIGGGEWNIHELRVMLEDILPQNSHFDNLEVEKDFPRIGKRVMLLNARRIYRQVNNTDIILLSIEDISASRDIDRKRDQFVSLVGHELKTPLTVVKGNLQMLNRHLAKHNDNVGRQYIAVANEHINRMTRLINDLLDRSKMRSTGFQYREERVNIDELVDTVISDMQVTTTHRLVRQGQAVGEVVGDMTRIGQVCMNLISNAIKYSPDDKQVVITTSRNNESIMIGVKDLGVGISKQDQRQIFEPFFQADGSNDSGFHNIGLGLSISKDIVEHYGGRIWVNSTKGRGATFCFTLPIPKTDA